MVKNNNTYYPFILVLALICLYSSCSLTRRLDPKDQVYMGTKLKISDKSNAASVDQFYLINTAIPVKSTKPGLGNIYVGLYNLFDSTAESGIKHWIKNKLGNKPVIYDHQLLNNTKAKFTYYLNGKGFFAQKVSCDTTTEGRKVYMTCNIDLNERYTIDSIIFPVDSTYAALKLDENLRRAVLKEGSYYDREKLDYERSRITQLAGDLGFAEFGTDNVFYYVDTAKNNNGVDLYVQILPPTDSTNHIRYILDSIHIFPKYTLNDTFKTTLNKAPISNTINIYEYNHYLNHDLINHLILEKTDTFYHRTNERKTINRFQDLGLFRFINIENRPNPNGKPGHMIQNILLSPEKIQNVSAEFELNNRSGNFLGTGASVRYRHRNLFGHAEQFNAALSGQVETQIGGGLSLINSSDLTGSAEILLPRLVLPFFNIKEGKTYIPKTSLKTNYTYQRRAQYYTLNSFVYKFGYLWKETSKKYHELYPLVINQVNVSNKTSEFQDLLDKDVRLKSSFDNTLIAGIQYNFTYSDQLGITDRKHFYLKNETETSGNVLNLFLGGNADDPVKVVGINYAQFFKNTIDLRKYLPVKNGDFAMRLLVGTAFSYGNSQELPYIKQYIIGGSNSVRAFRLRGLGPGSFVPEIPSDNSGFASQFVDQTGDLKLEMSVEYRFPIFRFFKGAAFADAGNVWLIQSIDKPEGVFKIDNFYKELGIGGGLGLRLDFNFFLIRMDLAVPFRAPQKDNGFVWTIDQINPFNKAWRQENLRYNLGIGYPF